jgi:RNA polymerase sigma-70 factor (ECF subfamily)
LFIEWRTLEPDVTANRIAPSALAIRRANFGCMGEQGQAADESAIAAALEKGDLSGAATEAMRLYGPQILRYLASVARSEADANEIFSMFSEDLWTGLADFRRECSFRTWAYKLAWHAAMRFFKDPYRKRGRPLASAEFSHVVEAVRTTTAAHLRTEVKDRVARLRASLDPAEQTLLVLRIDQRMAWEGIAEVMAESGDPASAATLRKRFERLTEKLRKLAQDEGLIPG